MPIVEKSISKLIHIRAGFCQGLGFVGVPQTRFALDLH